MSDNVPFGKYKGRPVADMLADAEYMSWLEAQPWFRERYQHLVARRDADAMSRTPVHNRLQTLFLDEAYCLAFLKVVRPEFWENAEPGFVEFWGDEPRERYIGAAFEKEGSDVLVFGGVIHRKRRGSVHSYWSFHGDEHGFILKIEIKPTVADEYPAVLRQMGRNKSRYLLVDRYEGEGATETQFQAMFKASGYTVVFKRDVDAAAKAGAL